MAKRIIELLAAWLLCAALIFAAGAPDAALAGETPAVEAEITEIEKYGHARLGITIADFEAMGFAPGDVVSVTAGGFSGDMPYLTGYYVDPGECMLRAYPGQENIAVCVNYGRFSELADVKAGDAVSIALREKGGARALEEIYNLSYGTERAGYTTDAEFANYRPIALGDIREGRLHRSASPVDDQYGRAAYAYSFMESAGINTVLNLADTDEALAQRFAGDEHLAPRYRELYERGRAMALGLPIDFASDGFAARVIEGLEFMAEGEPPYLVHCTEGKDRAGYVSMVLEAISGASADDIIADYMLSFVNYFGIEPGSEKYDLIARKNICVMLAEIAGTDDFASVDLRERAAQYLIDHGMAAEKLEMLISKLCDQ